MGRKGQRYTDEFKREAVELLKKSGKPVEEVARQLGIGANALYRWRSKPPAPEGRRAHAISLEEENRQLRRENLRLKQEQAFLKKAAAFFAKQND